MDNQKWFCLAAMTTIKRCMHFRLVWLMTVMFVVLATTPTFAKSAQSIQTFEGSVSKPQKVLRFASIRNSTIDFISRRILQEAYGRIGIEVEFHIYPIRRGVDMANIGGLDGVSHQGDIFLMKEYESLYVLPQHINRVYWRLYSRSENFQLNNFAELKKHRVGFVRGLRYFELFFDSLDAQVSVDSFDALLSLLRAKRFDLAITSDHDNSPRVNKDVCGGVPLYGTLLGHTLLYHYLHESHRELIPALGEVVLEMSLNGDIERIRRDVLANPPFDTTPTVPCIAP